MCQNSTVLPDSWAHVLIKGLRQVVHCDPGPEYPHMGRILDSFDFDVSKWSHGLV